MSWSGRANNQTVSFTDLKDAVDTGVFIGKSTITTSAEQVTKSDVDTYVWVNTLYPAYSGNQIINLLLNQICKKVVGVGGVQIMIR